MLDVYDRTAHCALRTRPNAITWKSGCPNEATRHALFVFCAVIINTIIACMLARFKDLAGCLQRQVCPCSKQVFPCSKQVCP